jgi:serine/threonine-protein kinase
MRTKTRLERVETQSAVCNALVSRAMNQVLAGRYRLERQLGKGGMGSVWLAEHLTLRSWVAVKLMDPSIAQLPEAAARFRREAQAAASIRSTHVVQVLDYGIDQGSPYLVMELLDGMTLAERVERVGRLSPEETRTILDQLARALGRAHASQIVHRDLKPDNVFLVREDDRDVVKILDFGIAKASGIGAVSVNTAAGVALGTAQYMSPEQLSGSNSVDHRTDLWALALVVCECLTGERVFASTEWGNLVLDICVRPIRSPSERGLHLPGFDDWFSKATDRRPEQRFASAQEMAASFATIVEAAAARGQHSGLSLTKPMDQPVPPEPQLSPLSPTLAEKTEPSLPPAVPAPVPLRVGGNSNARTKGMYLLTGLLLIVAASVVLFLRSQRSKPAEPIEARELSHGSALPNVPATATLAVVPIEPSGTEASAAPLGRARERAKTPATVPAPQSTVSSLPPISTLPPAQPQSPQRAPGRTLHCYLDPFTGRIRVVGSSKIPNARVFPCHQNPFTGAYQKL